jgi:hypothetical protein
MHKRPVALVCDGCGVLLKGIVKKVPFVQHAFERTYNRLARCETGSVAGICRIGQPHGPRSV